MPAGAGAPVNEESIVSWVVGVREEIKMYFFEGCRLFCRGRRRIFLAHVRARAAMTRNELSGGAWVQERFREPGRFGELRVFRHEIPDVVLCDGTSEARVEELEARGAAFGKAWDCQTPRRARLLEGCELIDCCQRISRVADWNYLFEMHASQLLLDLRCGVRLGWRQIVVLLVLRV